MALVTLSAPYNRVSGRVGTQPIVNTFNGGQTLIRDFVTPANPASTDQQAVRDAFSLLTKNWKLLTQSQRTAWTTWATSHTVTNRLGTVVKRTGLSAYVELGSIEYFRTGTLLSSAPTLAQPSPITGITFVPYTDDTVIQVTMTHGISVVTGLYVMFRQTPETLYQSQNPKLTDYRMIMGVGATSFLPLDSSTATYLWPSSGIIPPRFQVTGDGFMGFEAQIVNAQGWASLPFRTFSAVSIAP